MGCSPRNLVHFWMCPDGMSIYPPSILHIARILASFDSVMNWVFFFQQSESKSFVISLTLSDSNCDFSFPTNFITERQHGRSKSNNFESLVTFFPGEIWLIWMRISYIVIVKQRFDVVFRRYERLSWLQDKKSRKLCIKSEWSGIESSRAEGHNLVTAHRECQDSKHCLKSSHSKWKW
jgi:hypothetical protein